MADAEKILAVARRIGRAWEAGTQIVSVVSAMGDTTDTICVPTSLGAHVAAI